MKYTSNHNFKLPAPSDTIDVEVLNENFVNIDALIKTLEFAKADKNSPSFTGAPTAPTASSSTNSTQIATTAFVQGLIQGIQTALSGKADIKIHQVLLVHRNLRLRRHLIFQRE